MPCCCIEVRVVHLGLSVNHAIHLFCNTNDIFEVLVTNNVRICMVVPRGLESLDEVLKCRTNAFESPTQWQE